MFDIDKWQEIFSTIEKNKLRTFLTGFSVAWGIFILIILMGSGKGFENGVRDQFGSDAVNSIWIWNGQTSMDFGGIQAGRRTQFTMKDYEDTKKLNNDRIEHISGRFNIWNNPTVTYKNEYCTPSIINVHSDNKYVEQNKILEGRFIDDLDIKEHTKVTVIDTVVRNALFKNKKETLGSYIKVNGISFKVVGVFKCLSEYDNNKVYLPISTAQIVYNKENILDGLAFTTKDITLQESQKLVEDLRAQFAKRHKFNKDDHRAINVNNNFEGYSQVMTLFKGIRIFIWIIGIGTIISGIVGVSNIMIIVVKERTKEIGIRKAIGASPASVVGLILFESVLITSFAGYIGLMAGVGLLELLRPYFTTSQNFFMNPEADIYIAIDATILLVVCGAVAGLFPSIRAARIRPIDALRDE
jgi:putative ABC transport system permease protein